MFLIIDSSLGIHCSVYAVDVLLDLYNQSVETICRSNYPAQYKYSIPSCQCHLAQSDLLVPLCVSAHAHDKASNTLMHTCAHTSYIEIVSYLFSNASYSVLPKQLLDTTSGYHLDP